MEPFVWIFEEDLTEEQKESTARSLARGHKPIWEKPVFFYLVKESFWRTHYYIEDRHISAEFFSAYPQVKKLGIGEEAESLFAYDGEIETLEAALLEHGIRRAFWEEKNGDQSTAS